MNGYQYWTGLLQDVQWTIDGNAQQPLNFPGIDAAGTFIEARPPQIFDVTLALTIGTVNGVGLSSISDSITNAITGYVNSLGQGNAVVMGEIIALVMAVPGVATAVFTTPIPSTVEIPIASKATARASSSSIVLS
jgi:hypothetical protein